MYKCFSLTCEISALVDVCEGIVVCEAQFLIKIVPGSCFSKTNISSMCFPIALQYNNGPQLEIANFYCEINRKENKLAALLGWTIVDLHLSIDCINLFGKYLNTYDFLCDWLIVIGLEGEEGVWGPNAVSPLMSSGLSNSAARLPVIKPVLHCTCVCRPRSHHHPPPCPRPSHLRKEKIKKNFSLDIKVMYRI